MRFLLRSLLIGAGWLSLATALLAAPVSLQLTVHGDFDPGSTGAAADNAESLSVLSLQTAMVSYQSAALNLVLQPGDTVEASVGALSTATGSADPIAFDGARLNLTLVAEDPAVSTPIGVLSSALTGSVGSGSEVLNLTWAAPTTVTFTTTDCVPKDITVTVEPVSALASGGPEADIIATIHMDYATPFEPGDTDGSGSVDLIDAVRSLHLASGIDAASCEEFERADLDGNGILDIVDACMIARKALGTS
ncbi:MAG TPA: dockerin type I repeat-containing protein [Armatimonadota bacterium]|jgi:hypothetical protein